MDSLNDSVADLQRRIQELNQTITSLREQTDERLLARLAELAALQKVTNAANSDLHLDATLHLVVETVAEVVKADVCSIYLYEGGDRLVLRATKGLNPEKVGQVSIRLGEGITGTAAKEGRPIASRDAWADPRFLYFPGLYEEPYKSMLSVPIVLYAHEKLIGVINIHTRYSKDFTPEEIRFLETIAGQIAIAIENSRLYEQTDQKLQQKVNALTTLQRVTSTIASTLDQQEVLKLLVKEAVSLSKADMAAIFLLEEGSQELEVIAQHGLDQEPVPPWRVPLGQGVVGKAVQECRAIALSDLRGDALEENLSPWAEGRGYRSIFCVPLASRDRTLGGLAVYTVEEREFSEDERQLLSLFADETAIALENARLYEEAQRNLKIKTALLLEMHHRVKNNLQTVAGLLSLQARHATSPQVAGPLRESVGRIQSIAAVHDLLSREQIGRASIRDLAKRIFEVVMANPIRPGLEISFHIEGGELSLNSQEATVFALLMNELLTNSISHGFAGRGSGTIILSTHAENGNLRLQLRDNGQGLPPHFSLEKNVGLGLRIVQSLVETDLRGRFSLDNRGGAVATIEFLLP